MSIVSPSRGPINQNRRQAPSFLLPASPGFGFSKTKKEISCRYLLLQEKGTRSFVNPGDTPSLFFLLTLNGRLSFQEKLFCRVLGASSCSQRRRPLSSLTKTPSEHGPVSRFSLLLGRFRCGRSRGRCSSCGSRRGRSRSGRRGLSFGFRLRCFFSLAADPKISQVDEHRHGKKEKNPFLHIRSPPF